MSVLNRRLQECCCPCVHVSVCILMYMHEKTCIDTCVNVQTCMNTYTYNNIGCLY